MARTEHVTSAAAASRAARASDRAPVQPCTRNDVATAAGVSSATVSRAYNRPRAVSPEKLARIRSAAAALGYVPDRAASSLRRNRGGGILLILRALSPDDMSESRVYNWFYADALIHVQSVLETTMFHLQIAGQRPGESLRDLIGRHRCDGVVLGLGVVMRPSDLSWLSTAGFPCVCCTQTDHVRNGNVCYIDERAGGGVAADAFLSRRLRRLAHVTGMLDANHVCKARWLGFRERARRDGVEPVLVNGSLGIRGGYESGLLLAPRIKTGEVDSVFVVNDLTAVGVLQALQECGIAVPRDVSLIGYDNLPFRMTLGVPLATIDVSIGRLYGRAAECLVDCIRSPSPVHERITPLFVPGDSLGQGA